MTTDKLASLSHDLRTPLATLKLAAGLLAERRKATADAEEATIIALLEQNVARVEAIAEELSRMAKGLKGVAYSRSGEARKGSSR